MVDEARVQQLRRLLGAAGRAHHQAVGGPSDTWSQWYADFLLPDIPEHIGFEPTADQVADWLRRADEAHRVDAPDERWPLFYAQWILENVVG